MKMDRDRAGLEKNTTRDRAGSGFDRDSECFHIVRGRQLLCEI